MHRRSAFAFVRLAFVVEPPEPVFVALAVEFGPEIGSAVEPFQPAAAPFVVLSFEFVLAYEHAARIAAEQFQSLYFVSSAADFVPVTEYDLYGFEEMFEFLQKKKMDFDYAWTE